MFLEKLSLFGSQGSGSHYLKSCWPWRKPKSSVNGFLTLNFLVSYRETSWDFLPWLSWHCARHPQARQEEEWPRLNFLPLSQDRDFGVKCWDTKYKVLFLKFLSLHTDSYLILIFRNLILSSRKDVSLIILSKFFWDGPKKS